LAASSQARKDAAQTDRTTDQQGFNSKTEKDSTTTCSTPQPLPAAMHVKKRDLSRFLDCAGLTERQHQCASLRWECELSVSAIARELNIRRITVDEHLKYARRKMEASGQYEKIRENFSEVNPGEE
jgi:DNA-directed RNA polymerase specialized sigma24 family protein